MVALKDSFTSSGAKFFYQQEAMQGLRAGKPRPVVSHLMLTDVCNHACAFCSVHHREGDSLAFDDVLAYLDTLIPLGLRATILSGGGNPILYKCKKTGANFNDVVDAIHGRGLEIGLITNGMPLKKFVVPYLDENGVDFGDTWRESWATVKPETLDKLTWVRVSMAGLDHQEREVYVPDIDPSKTTLGLSYVFHDIYATEADTKHGAVSTQADLLKLGVSMVSPTWAADDRVRSLTDAFIRYAVAHRPAYLRVLPNCLEPGLIPERCRTLQGICNDVNGIVGREVAFVQHKPPAAPKACYLGYVHPVLNTDGYVYPCDSCVLNEAAGHKFANPWRVCHWSEVGQMYQQGSRSLIRDPVTQCPGCVFTTSNTILAGVVDGTADLTPPSVVPEHPNFI